MSDIDPELVEVIDRAFPTFEAVYTAAEEIERARETDGWRAVQHVLGAELSGIEARLSRGRKPLDQAEYALLHGRLGALQLAQGLGDAIVARAAERRQEQAEKHETEGAGSSSGR